MANPTPTDLTNYLLTIGVTPISQIDEQGIIDATIAEFERLTGRRKYQGDSGTTAVRYTLPYPFGENIILEIEDCWEVTEVRSGYNGTAGTGTVLTEYEDFLFLPMNYTQRALPVEAIRFLTYADTAPGAILITGKLGVASTMPQDVFNAILAGAAAQVLIQQAGESGTITEQKQGDRQVKFGSGSDSTIARLQAQFNHAVTRWLKMVRV